MRVSDLEGQQAILRILIVLHQKGPLGIKEIMDEIGTSQVSVYNSLKRLRKLGLVHDDKMTEFPFRREQYLTRLGKEFSVKLVEASEILESK